VFSAPSSPWFTGLRSTPRGALYLFSVGASVLGFLALTHATPFGASGTAVAYAEAIHHAVSPVALGRIETLLVHVGQKVSVGEPLVKLDTRELLASREKAVAQLAELEAAVVAATADEELRMTRDELRMLETRAQERGSRAELTELSQRMKRLDALLDEQMIQAGPAEAARERQSQLAARLEAFDEAKQLGQAGLAQGSAGQHQRARTLQLHVEPARQAVYVQKASIRQLELQLEELTLRAPVDGVVSTISHQAGEVVSAGAEVVSLVSTRPGVLIAELQEALAGRVQVGQGVSVRPRDVFAHALHGHVIELAPEVDELAPRARPSPAISAWGRRATLQLDDGNDVLPGQAFSVSLD